MTDILRKAILENCQLIRILFKIETMGSYFKPPKELLQQLNVVLRTEIRLVPGIDDERSAEQLVHNALP